MMKMQALLLSLVLACSLSRARAESVDVDQVTLGAMTERADVVVVAEAAAEQAEQTADQPWSFRVEEVLRGRAAAPTVRVERPAAPHRHGAPEIRPGGRYLLFLSADAQRGGALVPVASPWGLRDMAEPGVSALAEHARRYAATLDGEGRVQKPADLASLLVEALGSPASGIPGSAGRDLVRHSELAATLTPAQRRAVDAALDRPRKGDLDLASIIDAVGVAGTNAADEQLVARLLDPATRHLRLNITAAMRRHARPELVALLAARIGDAGEAQRADLANALGRLDLRASAPSLLKLLTDASPSVRVEAAHGLGLLARAVRVPREGAGPEAPREKLDDAIEPLVTSLGDPKDERVHRSVCWALAQVDTQPAWAALRALRDTSPDARVRELAAAYLLHPRVELILER